MISPLNVGAVARRQFPSALLPGQAEFSPSFEGQKTSDLVTERAQGPRREHSNTNVTGQVEMRSEASIRTV